MVNLNNLTVGGLPDNRTQAIAKIPQQAQAQFATTDQLQILQYVAVRLGLYDAADLIQRRFLSN